MFKVMTALMSIVAAIFVIGVLVCMFCIGMAALSLFVKIMIPFIFIFLVLSVIAWFVG